MMEEVISKKIQWHKDLARTTSSTRLYLTSKCTYYFAWVVERNKFIKTKVLQTAYLKKQMYSSTKEQEQEEVEEKECTR